MAKHKAAAPKTASKTKAAAKTAIKTKTTIKSAASKASGMKKLATPKPVVRGKVTAKPAAKPKIAAKPLTSKQKVEIKNKMITKSTAVAREKAAPTVDSSPAKAPAKPAVVKTDGVKPVAAKLAAPANVNAPATEAAPALASAPANTNVKPAKAAAPKSAPKLTVATSDGQPVKPATKAAAPVAAAAAAAVVPAVVAKPVPVKEPEFAEGDYVVYPTHGVGRIQGVVTQEIAGTTLKVIVINFEKERMTLRVPVAKATNSGLRRLSSRKEMETALKTLKGRSRVRRMMWSRRAQEYEAKINSGDPVSIAEVVRDLYRNAGQPDQSYSERQIYQAALDRLARELAAVEKIDEMAAAQKLESVLRAA
jgi:CarD family transcriptional regulator